MPALTINSQSEIMRAGSHHSSKRLVLKRWTKGARALYGAMGVYAVYGGTGECLYVGKSTDLGKRLLRFFTPRKMSSCSANERSFNIKGKTFFNCYVEVTTISNKHKLDSFERTMIAIKKPTFNVLLNYHD